MDESTLAQLKTDFEDARRRLGGQRGSTASALRGLLDELAALVRWARCNPDTADGCGVGRELLASTTLVKAAVDRLAEKMSKKHDDHTESDAAAWVAARVKNGEAT